MTAAKDIVERLRASGSADPLTGEAILTIEALRAELAEEKRTSEYVLNSYADENQRISDERDAKAKRVTELGCLYTDEKVRREQAEAERDAAREALAALEERTAKLLSLAQEWPEAAELPGPRNEEEAITAWFRSMQRNNITTLDDFINYLRQRLALCARATLAAKGPK